MGDEPQHYTPHTPPGELPAVPSVPLYEGAHMDPWTVRALATLCGIQPSQFERYCRSLRHQ